MLSESILLDLSGTVLLISVVGTILTVVAFLYRRELQDRYQATRARWREFQHRLPWVLRVAVKAVLGITGTTLILLGLPLVPLPGPGALVTLAGIAVLDFEFGWIVPLTRWVTGYLPQFLIPTSFQQGLQSIDRA